MGFGDNSLLGGSMTSIRVVIRDVPTMLREILEQAISGEPDMEVIAESLLPEPFVDDTHLLPDVVVLGQRDAGSLERGPAELDRWPRSRVLMITKRGRTAVLYELVPHRRDLGELSPDQL